MGLCATLTFVLALGVSSVVGSAGPSIGILLGWQLLLGPLVLGIASLGMFRGLLPGAGLVALAPGVPEAQPALSMSASRSPPTSCSGRPSRPPPGRG